MESRSLKGTEGYVRLSLTKNPGHPLRFIAVATAMNRHEAAGRQRQAGLLSPPGSTKREPFGVLLIDLDYLKNNTRHSDAVPQLLLFILKS